MKTEDLQYIQDTIKNEGTYYAFIHYSNFEEIEDEKFHELRTAFINAAKELVEYCGLDFSES